MTLRLKSVLRHEGGNSFIEMALVMPVLAALVLGMVDVARAVSARLALEQASQRAVEWIQRNGFDTSNVTTIQNDAVAAAGTGSSATVDYWMQCGASTTHLDFTTGACGSGQATARYVEIRMQTSFTPLFGTRFFPGANSDGTYTLNNNAGVRVQ